MKHLKILKTSTFVVIYAVASPLGIIGFYALEMSKHGRIALSDSIAAVLVWIILGGAYIAMGRHLSRKLASK